MGLTIAPGDWYSKLILTPVRAAPLGASQPTRVQFTYDIDGSTADGVFPCVYSN